ncbi:hypothetical protein HELRODRAFT_158705 [Helobdella robusta]|uniref:Uncharacterized protein n=1 Tax=Helobdella robusta TaxID=6412 RepID=T1EN53_HELRO|nr:hypothetical protein HELRODRAFT_158705 [Helobdella robusta]ESO12235.1 hypothetical protein HELRODRAFT_158705 [Helobdella robusta]
MAVMVSPPFQQLFKSVRSYRKINRDEFRDSIRKSDLCCPNTYSGYDTNTLFNLYESTFGQFIDQYASIKCIKVRSKSRGWFDDECYKIKHSTRRFEMIYRSTKNPIDLNRWKSAIDLKKLIQSSNGKSCSLDPLSTFLLKEQLDLLLPFLCHLHSTMNFENRWVLRSALNFASDGEVVREVGREFQRKGPEKAKADLAKECLTRVKKKREEEDDRKPGRLDNVHIGDKALKYLTRMKKLRTVILTGTSVSVCICNCYQYCIVVCEFLFKTLKDLCVTELKAMLKLKSSTYHEISSLLEVKTSGWAAPVVNYWKSHELRHINGDEQFTVDEKNDVCRGSRKRFCELITLLFNFILF